MKNIFANKLTKIGMFCLLLISIMFKPVFADASSIKSISSVQTKYVNTIVSAPMNSYYCGNGNIYFRISGSYTLSSGVASNPNFTVSMQSYDPSDWRPVFQYATYSSSGSSIRVNIYYYFTTTYFDCPIGSGPQYTMYTAYVS